jgi:hypothetical protein
MRVVPRSLSWHPSHMQRLLDCPAVCFADTCCAVLCYASCCRPSRSWRSSRKQQQPIELASSSAAPGDVSRTRCSMLAVSCGPVCVQNVSSSMHALRACLLGWTPDSGAMPCVFTHAMRHCIVLYAIGTTVFANAGVDCTVPLYRVLTHVPDCVKLRGPRCKAWFANASSD